MLTSFYTSINAYIIKLIWIKKITIHTFFKNMSENRIVWTEGTIPSFTTELRLAFVDGLFRAFPDPPKRLGIL